MTEEKKTNISKEFKEAENKKPNVIIKVGMLGDPSVGKTTLMVKYIKDQYEDGYLNTLGVNFMEKIVELKNCNVAISIWDLGGDQQFASLMPLICNDAKVILFIFDLTQKASLYSVKRWYKEAKKENSNFTPFLIGTKFDLFDEENDMYKNDIIHQSRKYSEKMNCPLIFCSSRQSINVKKIFKIIIAKAFNLPLNLKSKGNALCEYGQKDKKEKKIKKKKEDKKDKKDRKRKDKKKKKKHKKKKDKKKKNSNNDSDNDDDDSGSEDDIDEKN